MDTDPEKLLTIGQAALRLGRPVYEVRAAENRGDLQCLRTLGGHRRFRQSDVDRLARRHETTT